MKPAWRWFVLLLLLAGYVRPAELQAQERREDPDPILTEVGARFAVGTTTIRPSPEDRMFDVVARAEQGYSLGLYGTLLSRGWLRLQTEFLFSSRQFTLAQTTSDLISTYSLKYLELPALAYLDIPLPVRARPFVVLGVSPGVRIEAEHSLGANLDGIVHRFDFGLVGAAGARVRLTASWDLMVELRGVYGLADVFVRTPRKGSALFLAVSLGRQRVPRRDSSRVPDAESMETLSWRARHMPARDASPRGGDRASLRRKDPSAELSYAFAYVPERSTDERCIEQRDPRAPGHSTVSTSCLPGGLEPGIRAGLASTTGLVMIPAGVAMSPAVAWSCSGAPEPAQLVAGDVIDHVIIAGRSRMLHVHMTSGQVYCYPLQSGAPIPPGGTYQGSKSDLELIIRWLDGSHQYMTLELAGLEEPVLEAWRRIQAGESFRLIVLANHVATGKLGRELEARGLSSKTADSIASKLADDVRFTVEEARSLATALGKSMNASEDLTWFLPFDDKDWQAWIRRYAGKPGAFGPVQGRQSPRALEKILASRKQALGIKDPPVVTARQREQQVAQDPELIAAWNSLAPWERDLWKDYWKRYPGSTQGSDTDLSLTEDARFRLALSMSPEHMPAGVRDAADALFKDPLFQATCMTGIMLYAVAILNPEPLFSKLTAAVITAGLLTVFSYSEIHQLVTAWFRLHEQSAQARTLAELQAAAHEFGKSIGATGFRVIVALATIFLGKALPTVKPGPTTTPTALAVVTSGRTAGAVAVRTLVIDGIEVEILADGTIVLPILASVTADSAGGGTTGSGHTQASGARKDTPETTTSKLTGKGTANDDVPKAAKRHLDGNDRTSQTLPSNRPAATATGNPSSTADELAAAAARARARVGQGRGPVYGTRVHAAFKAEVDSLGRSYLRTEVSYLDGRVVQHGTPGSVRLDVVEGPLDAPTAVYDLKTGGAKLTSARINKIRRHLPNDSQNVPIMEIR